MKRIRCRGFQAFLVLLLFFYLKKVLKMLLVDATHVTFQFVCNLFNCFFHLKKNSKVKMQPGFAYYRIFLLLVMIDIEAIQFKEVSE